MLPAWTTGDKVARTLRRLGDRRRPLAWGVGLWALVVALPYGDLYPGIGLARGIALSLALLPPLAMTLAAMAAEDHLLLAVGPGSLLPVLIACPELLGPRAAGPLEGVAVAVVGLVFVVTALDPGHGATGAARTRLWRLWRLPAGVAGRLSVGLGLVWLVMAWWPTHLPPERAEAVRTARVAAVAVGWVALRTLPIARARGGAEADTAASLLVRRAVWLGLGVAALLWWTAGPESPP